MPSDDDEGSEVDELMSISMTANGPGGKATNSNNDDDGQDFEEVANDQDFDAVGGTVVNEDVDMGSGDDGGDVVTNGVSPSCLLVVSCTMVIEIYIDQHHAIIQAYQKNCSSLPPEDQAHKGASSSDILTKKNNKSS